MDITEEIKQLSDMGDEKLKVVKDCLLLAPKGVFLEVGTRRGGTALMALNTDNCEILIFIDPYGSKPYIDQNGVAPYVFPDQWWIESLSLISGKARELTKIVLPFKFTSYEYMDHNFELWLNGDTRFKDDLLYSYVLLDGDHTTEVVQKEINYFSTRMRKGGVLLVDNTDWMQLDLSDWEKPRYDMAYKVF